MLRKIFVFKTQLSYYSTLYLNDKTQNKLSYSVMLCKPGINTLGLMQKSIYIFIQLFEIS